MNEFVDATMSARVPTVVFDQWLDCNLETGFGAQLRRFARSYYATPDVAFGMVPAEACKGVFAQTAALPDGATCLRLVNNSPYPSTGHVKASAKSVYDLVCDREMPLTVDGKFELALKPCDVRVFRISGPEGAVECRFAFAAAVERELFDQAQFVLKQETLLRQVPGDMVARLSGDEFCVLLEGLASVIGRRGDPAALQTGAHHRAGRQRLRPRGPRRTPLRQVPEREMAGMGPLPRGSDRLGVESIPPPGLNCPYHVPYHEEPRSGLRELHVPLR